MTRKTSSEPPAATLPGEDRTLLEEIVSSYGSEQPDARAPSPPLVGECTDDRHPTLLGRARIRWAHGGETFERWLPTLVGVIVRTGDRVLLTQPANWPELLVTGVIDGFDEARERPVHATAALELRRDESIRVVTEDGAPVLEASASESGPVVRLLRGDVDVRIDGDLRVRAQSIALEASEGRVDITANDDVVIKGEIVHLN